MEVPQNRWLRENPNLKWMITGGIPLFWKPPCSDTQHLFLPNNMANIAQIAQIICIDTMEIRKFRWKSAPFQQVEDDDQETGRRIAGTPGSAGCDSNGDMMMSWERLTGELTCFVFRLYSWVSWILNGTQTVMDITDITIRKDSPAKAGNSQPTTRGCW